MHFTSLLLLPLLVAADQAALKDKVAKWFDKAKSYIPSEAPPNPIDASTAKVAGNVVEKINIRNWERRLSPKPDTEEEWMVYMTGGNKSCFGRCTPVDLKWNESVPLLAALPQPAGSPPLRLGIVDCEKDEVLCTAWASTMPSVYHFHLPKKSEPQAKSPLHIAPLNISTTTIDDIVSIPAASKSRYLEYVEYTGALHPLDGWMAKFGLLQPFGYVMWGIGSMPSWVMMIGISFISRQIMSRRMAGGRGMPTPGEAQQEPQVRLAPASPATPKSAGSKKKK
ncbi:uncharacterized protein Z518_00168 [Rhinocladiella mackenziei CBS 650.93]|uniref:Uncharacterized protein n=1 Tax=Rhinocladiella mackenziei CBS 650.93 TaxID=1442369 RepID=A0A0D2JI93_9EURO|nr:uncharacterized protein Z518_00168 [Rhinocladiella mackenziei CBS 650.93]KIX09090.1 hypothetical protein Z518_00168 [Rhinocladiella mackenziei CBS 650.93]